MSVRKTEATNNFIKKKRLKEISLMDKHSAEKNKINVFIIITQQIN